MSQLLKAFAVLTTCCLSVVVQADGLVPLDDNQMLSATVGNTLPSNLLIDLETNTALELELPADEDLNFANDQINGSTIEQGNWQLLENLRVRPQDSSQVETMIRSLGNQSLDIQDNIRSAGGLSQ